MPTSHYLFDVGFAFVDARAIAWSTDATLPSYLVDLARYELLDFTVAAIRAGPHDDAIEELAVDAPLMFHDARALARYDHAVHLAEQGGVPQAEPTSILTYRDGDDDIRHLVVTNGEAGLLDELLAGAPRFQTPLGRWPRGPVSRLRSKALRHFSGGSLRRES